MRGLTVILISAAPERVDAGFELAASHAALGRPTRLHLDRPAVASLSEERTTAQLRNLHELGVVVTACPSGLADFQVPIASLADLATPSGLVGVLADLGEDRLVTI